MAKLSPIVKLTRYLTKLGCENVANVIKDGEANPHVLATQIRYSIMQKHELETDPELRKLSAVCKKAGAPVILYRCKEEGCNEIVNHWKRFCSKHYTQPVPPAPKTKEQIRKEFRDKQAYRLGYVSTKEEAEKAVQA